MATMGSSRPISRLWMLRGKGAGSSVSIQHNLERLPEAQHLPAPRLQCFQHLRSFRHRLFLHEKTLCPATSAPTPHITRDQDPSPQLHSYHRVSTRSSLKHHGYEL